MAAYPHTLKSGLRPPAEAYPHTKISVAQSYPDTHLFGIQRTRPSAMSRLAVILVAVVGQTAAFHAPSISSAATARAPAPAAGLFDFLAVGKAGASHILLPPGSSKARYIKEEIEKGKMTFEAAAKEFSECPSASKGGNLGTFGRGQMVGPFDSYCFDPDSKVGALEIVKTSFGTHIVKLTKKP